MAPWREAGRGGGRGYLFVWTVLGAIVFAGGAALAQAALQLPAVAHAVPMSMAMTVLLAGAFQFTAWKARHLAYFRPAAAAHLMLPAHAGSAWRYGVWLGLHCSRACAG